MQTKEIFVSLILILSLILSFSTMIVFYPIVAQHSEMIIKKQNLSLTTFGPITITSDANFSDYGFPGDGSENNPFRIEDYLIIASSDSGIYIKGTSMNFTIQNCIIDAENHSIFIDSVFSGTGNIINNTCNDNIQNGIYIRNSAEVTIANNTCLNNYYGIFLYNSDYSVVTNNTCNYNNFHGILTEKSNYVNITNNHALNNVKIGIYLSQGSFSKIERNYCINNQESGIASSSSIQLKFHNNTCNENKRCGFDFYSCDEANFTSNICRYNRYAFLTIGGNKIRIEDNLISDCSEYGMKISVEDSIIFNNHITSDVWDGIHLTNGVNSTIANNTLIGNGISFPDSLFAFDTLTIENNTLNGEEIGYFVNLSNYTFSDPVYSQLILVESQNITIDGLLFEASKKSIHIIDCDVVDVVNCIFKDNILGAGLWIFQSRNVSVLECDFQNCQIGMYCRNSPYTLIENNDFIDNIMGMKFFRNHNSSVVANYFESTLRYAFDINQSNRTLVQGNIFLNNEYVSIIVSESSKSDINYNLFQNTLQYGVSFLADTNENLVHHNTFIDNNQGGISQAFDAGFNNKWFDETTLEGNYWSDYSGSGAYMIEGSASSFDPTPLSSPPVPIISEFRTNALLFLIFVLSTVILIPYVQIKREKISI